MKCKYCGGDVSLDDHFCQHCGRPVDQAQRHQMEMEQYEAEFEETKQEALEKISVASGGGFPVGIRLAIIGALIAALVFMFANFDPYTVNERKEQRAAKKNYDAYIAQMEDYLAGRDYATFSAFCRKHQLEYNRDYKSYRSIITASMYYNNVYRALQELAFATKDSADRSYYVKELSKYVNNFYDGVGDDRHVVRDEDLLRQADDEAAHAAHEAIERLLAVAQLFGDVVVLHDGPGDELREQVSRALGRGGGVPAGSVAEQEDRPDRTGPGQGAQ